MIPCGCGCGTLIEEFDKYGRTRKYIVGHGTKIKLPFKGKHHTEESKLKIRDSKKGCVPWNKGKKCPEISISHIGNKNPAWKGGVTYLNQGIRNLDNFVSWREQVFVRDSYTCQNCGKVGGELNSHHKKSLSLILEKYNITTIEQAIDCSELWDISNGITLCEECHKKEHYEKGYKIC